MHGHLWIEEPIVTVDLQESGDERVIRLKLTEGGASGLSVWSGKIDVAQLISALTEAQVWAKRRA